MRVELAEYERPAASEHTFTSSQYIHFKSFDIHFSDRTGATQVLELIV
jgi:hypothetical protein